MLAVAGALVALAACDRAADAQLSAEAGSGETTRPRGAERAGSEAAAAPAAEGAAQALAGQAAYREEGFELSIVAPQEVKVGEAGEATVTLEAKAPYKVNEEYPIKLKLGPSPGLTFPASTVGKDKVTLEPKKAVMKVPFTPKAAGEQTLGGTFAFSVCTDERCLIEKRELAVRLVAR